MKKTGEEARYLDIAQRAARAAGKIMLNGLGKDKNIRFKGAEINLVTDIDQECEAVIKKMIRREFSDHGFLAEESDIENEQAEHVWIIDPLDGTTNFAHEYPAFATSIALEVKGKIEAGVVYDPVRKEMFHAQRGKGAYLNGKRIGVSSVTKLRRALLVSGFPYDIKPAHIKYFTHFLMKAQGIRRDGSAALDLCYVAMGRLDGFFELGLNPWDTAAGSVILEEAGGKLTDFAGKKYSIYGIQCIASNGKIHRQLVNEFDLIYNGKLASPV